MTSSRRDFAYIALRNVPTDAGSLVVVLDRHGDDIEEQAGHSPWSRGSGSPYTSDPRGRGNRRRRAEPALRKHAFRVRDGAGRRPRDVLAPPESVRRGARRHEVVASQGDPAPPAPPA